MRANTSTCACDQVLLHTCVQASASLDLCPAQRAVLLSFLIEEIPRLGTAPPQDTLPRESSSDDSLSICELHQPLDRVFRTYEGELDSVEHDRIE
jgi:hypothetical protein